MHLFITTAKQWFWNSAWVAPKFLQPTGGLLCCSKIIFLNDLRIHHTGRWWSRSKSKVFSLLFCFCFEARIFCWFRIECYFYWNKDFFSYNVWSEISFVGLLSAMIKGKSWLFASFEEMSHQVVQLVTFLPISRSFWGYFVCPSLILFIRFVFLLILAIFETNSWATIFCLV